MEIPCIIIKNWIIVKCNSRVLIGLAAMVYEPLYHAREVATINCFLVALEKEISKGYQYYLIVFNETIIRVALVGYEMMIANSARSASLAIISYPTHAGGIIVIKLSYPIVISM